MLYWAVAACQHSKYIQQPFVSTEDEEIKQVARSVGAGVIDRPAELAGDKVFKQHVICHGMKFLKEELGLQPDLILSIQPNSPQITATDLDAAIDVFFQYNRKEIFSVDQNLMQNAAFRIMSKDVVCLESLSIHAGVFIAEYMDVHTIEDVEAIEATGELQQRLAEWGAQ